MIKTHAHIVIGVVAAFLVLGIAPEAFARIGVGMGAGEIRLTDQIKPGGIYTLPKLRIFNTGDEKTTYGMGVAYHQERLEMRPAQDWFSFSPKTFTLAAGQSEEVSISMTVPVNAEPGDYFAFLESGPVASDKPGTSVGVAVASKLFFTVVPANFFQAVLHRVSTFFSTYAPWSWIGLGLLVFAALVFSFKRFFSFNIAIRKN